MTSPRHCTGVVCICFTRTCFSRNACFSRYAPSTPTNIGRRKGIMKRDERGKGSLSLIYSVSHPFFRRSVASLETFRSKVFSHGESAIATSIDRYSSRSFSFNSPRGVGVLHAYLTGSRRCYLFSYVVISDGWRYIWSDPGVFSREAGVVSESQGSANPIPYFAASSYRPCHNADAPHCNDRAVVCLASACAS